MIENNNYLESQLRKNFIFFWGHHTKFNSVGKECLSQWYQYSPFEINGIIFKTAEHYMMAKKAELMDDENSLKKILTSKTPKDAKAIGRQIKNFNSTLWNEKKLSIVVEGNFHKFNQNDNIKAFLLKTKDKILVEASPYDKIWGVGMTQDDSNILYPSKWKGENLLGIALMKVRTKLKKK